MGRNSGSLFNLLMLFLLLKMCPLTSCKSYLELLLRPCNVFALLQSGQQHSAKMMIFHDFEKMKNCRLLNKYWNKQIVKVTNPVWLRSAEYCL